mmetsp:Transcript_46223/g.91160  ORF Transcript_46223/g.91160 Transcript_46223/m.91160 type:complete len:90 (-) Transcript_46223:389-658(-)
MSIPAARQAGVATEAQISQSIFHGIVACRSDGTAGMSAIPTPSSGVSRVPPWHGSLISFCPTELPPFPAWTKTLLPSPSLHPHIHSKAR